jgi:hypothetical protein
VDAEVRKRLFEEHSIDKDTHLPLCPLENEIDYLFEAYEVGRDG